MNLYHLRYFVTLAHLEHYTRAAEELMITQPSLSHAIATLEDELGIQLFEKIGRNIVLTKCGRLYLEDVEAALRVLDTGADNIKKVASGGGIIDIAFLRTLGTDLVPKLISDFQKENANKEITFNLSSDSGLTQDILDGLKTKKYDIAFCSKKEKEPLIDFVPIAAQELVVIVPKGHPLSCKKSLNLAETLCYKHIVFKHKSGLRQVIDSIFYKINAFPEVMYEVEEDQVAAGFVSYGFGIAVVPNMQILESMNLDIISIDSPQWERYFYVATLKNIYRTPVVEAFRKFAINSSNT